MKNVLLIICTIALLVSFKAPISFKQLDSTIPGQMPALAKGKNGYLHLVFGRGDSIMYAYSNDKGQTFSVPSLISTLPHLAASHTRGPQIAATKEGLVITACTSQGNIFSYTGQGFGKWSQPKRVNDLDTVAKENLMSLSSDGNNVYAVWLDLRDKNNKVFGAKSSDGGKSWSRNIIVYTSPDKTVCECCRPSVVVKGNKVHVMFRNWLNGNRDLYLISSSDGGSSFGTAQKLGNDSWALNGCPMDGGGLVVDEKGNPKTVWNRKGTIYALTPGRPETALGQGRSCTMETVNGHDFYAWVEKGEVIVSTPRGVKKSLGKGQLPVLKAIDEHHVLCVWESATRIQKTVLEL